MSRSTSFIYIVDVDGVMHYVRAVSKGRAVKAALKNILVRRATTDQIVSYLESGKKLIDATKEK